MTREFMSRMASLAFGLCCLPVFAQHINHPLGIERQLNYQRAGNIDQVALFSGALTARIPIGSFNLIYNSNVWRYRGEVNSDGSPAIAASVDREMTAGLGWHLGWGEVYSPSHWYNDNDDGDWLYVDELGAHHIFHDRNLHEGEPDTELKYRYSRDGSYMRLHLVNNIHVTIEFPDGSRRLFDSGTTGLETTYHLHKIWSSIPAQQDPLPEPDFVIEYDRHPNQGNNQILDKQWRTVTDRYGRVTHITLSQDYPDIHRVVTQIDMPAPHGQTATYRFTYREKHVTVSCKDTWDGTGATRGVPFLVDIEMPDGTHFNMDAGDGEVRYNRHPGCDVEDLGGVISGISLPTGGQIEWTFQEYEFPPGDNNSPFNTSAGVKTRQLLDHAGTEVGNPWRYRVSTSDVGEHGPEDFDVDFYNECVYPDGRCVKNYFNAIYTRHTQVNGHNREDLGPRGWERGLPFVYHNSVGEGGEQKYLSNELYESHDPQTKACSGAVVQSNYVRYRRDVLPGQSAGSPISEWYRVNRQLEGVRVVYNTDENRYVDTQYSDFTGLGMFRNSTTKGTVWADSANDELRTSTVNYDAARGTYPGNYEPVTSDMPWLFGIADWSVKTEPDAVGVTTVKSESQFDADGFLRCTRVFADGTNRGEHDIVNVLERDSTDVLGLVRHVKTYGGDLQILTTEGSVCGIDPSVATPEFWVSNEYENGVLVASWRVDPANPEASPPFLTYDVDLDPQTDAVLVSRDPNGFTTTNTYDNAGRIAVSIPQEGAATHIEYQTFLADPLTQAGVTTLQKSGETVLSRSFVQVDGFGREVLQGRTLADGTVTTKEKTLDVLGRLITVSEWGDASKQTTFSQFDPWGRAQLVTPPDSSSGFGSVNHNQEIQFTGARIMIATTRRALSVDEESPVEKAFEYDSYGRLRKVRELSGSGLSEETPTTYFYNVNNQMTRIDSGVAPVVQTRTNTYDARGFLLTESFPESPFGQTYQGYNSLGTFTNMQDGEHHLEYRHDYMNRLLRIVDLENQNRTVTENAWDTAPGRGLGKVHWSEQHNYIVNPNNLPWTASPGEDVRVKQQFFYEGLAGAESRRDTHVTSSLEEVVFRQDMTYTDLGQIDTYTYPRCIQPSPAACLNSSAGENGGTARQLDYRYTNGALTGVDDATGDFNWATWTYHNSGSWATVNHTNGVVDNQTMDPNFKNRVHRIFTTGVNSGQDFDSGVLQFDGANNLKAAGSTSYVYDKVGRLTASVNTGQVDQVFSYDRFGNMYYEDLDFPMEDIDPATNRFVGGNYDNAGNLLTYDPGFGMWNWFYDERNKVAAQNTLNYAYDSFGERIATFSLGGTTIDIRDPAGRRRSTLGYTTHGIVWDRRSDDIWAGNRLVGSAKPQGNYHFHLDRSGSTKLITDEEGDVAHQFEYAPYGFEYNTGHGGTADENFKNLFTGHERDFSTGADYMHARHYHPQLGRFTSVDLLKGTASNPQSLNRYAYVAGNPMNATDPTGLQTQYLEAPTFTENPYFALGYVDIFSRYDTNTIFISTSLRHRIAVANRKQENQNFQPGWLQASISSDWWMDNGSDSSGEESTGFRGLPPDINMASVTTGSETLDALIVAWLVAKQIYQTLKKSPKFPKEVKEIYKENIKTYKPLYNQFRIWGSQSVRGFVGRAGLKKLFGLKGLAFGVGYGGGRIASEYTGFDDWFSDFLADGMVDQINTPYSPPPWATPQ